MSESIGVFLSRMQPLHVGHLGMIDKALSENDKVIILIGSSNKNGTTRNPIGIDVRREILNEELENKYGKNYERIIIKELPDWSSEDDIASNLEWGRYLYYNIVSACREKKVFNVFFGQA